MNTPTLKRESLIKAWKNRADYKGYDKSKGSMDRIDNLRGHTLDNCVPCCYECNTARNNNFTFDEMIKIGETIRSIKEKRNENK